MKKGENLVSQNKIGKIFFIVVFLFITPVLFIGQSYAYSLGVHEKITYNVIEQNKTKINGYLKNIGLDNGINENLKNSFLWKKTVREWMEYGSWMEDIDVSILWSHFYDPLTNEGYSIGGIVSQSAYDRANDLPNYGPWVWARERLYDGLTQTDNNLREKYLGIAFQALGSAMHLVQDVSVPAHTRNDGHLPLVDEEPYETYTAQRYKELTYTAIPFPLWNQSTSPNAPRQFWDTDTYDGYNASAGINQGLAEYTNANFFSKDTIFVDAYPYPKKSSTNLQEYLDQNLLPEIVFGEDNIPDTSFWIKKERDGETIDHFVKPGYLTKEALDAGNPIYVLTFMLDDVCHKDYAQKLIPRAVGYSAGLLDYFFRGSIEITIPTVGIYAQTNDPNQGFTTIKLLAKNTTSTGEEMTDGSIELVVKYRLALEDPFQSNPVPTTDEFSYKVVPEFNNIRSIPRGAPVELTFDSGQNTIIPINATDVYLQLVYKGRLGNEDGAVAVGFKDISEPTPIDLFNNMDKICLNGGWYNTGSPEAINQVDPNHDGIPDWDIYTHNINNAYLKISNINDPINASPSNYTFYTPLITFGTLYRAYVLSDYEYTFNYSNYMTGVTTTSEDTWTHANGGVITGSKAASAIKNQVDYHVESQTECDTVGATAPCDIRYYPIFYPFRSINIWGPAGYIIDNPKYPIDTNCPWELLP